MSENLSEYLFFHLHFFFFISVFAYSLVAALEGATPSQCEDEFIHIWKNQERIWCCTLEDKTSSDKHAENQRIDRNERADFKKNDIEFRQKDFDYSDVWNFEDFHTNWKKKNCQQINTSTQINDYIIEKSWSDVDTNQEQTTFKR